MNIQKVKRVLSAKGSQAAIADQVGLTQTVVAFILNRSKRDGLTPQEISKKLNYPARQTK